MSMGSMRDSLARVMAFSAVPPMPMPSMPGGHQPAPMVGTVLRTQSTMESEGLSMANLDLASEPPPLAGDGDVERRAGDELDDDHGGGVVAGVFAGEGGVGEDGGAEDVVGVEPGLADALVDHLLHGQHAVGRRRAAQLDVHADLDEGGDDAGVLADGAMAFGAHAGVDEDLGDGVFGGGGLLELVGAGEVGDVVGGVVEADVLERVGYGADYVVLLDDGHGSARSYLLL